jgi:hypothetical protein
MRIFVKFEAVIIAIDRGLQVAQDSIDPMEAPHIGALALFTDNLWMMRTPDDFNSSKAGQSVGNNRC